MTKFFKLTPLEKNSAQYFIDVYKKNKGWTVTETYRWGYGFRAIDDPVTKWEAKNEAKCYPDVCGSAGGADLRDGSSAIFEYRGLVSKKERAQIEKIWYEGDDEGISGIAWLLGTDEHGWEIEEEKIIIQEKEEKNQKKKLKNLEIEQPNYQKEDARERRPNFKYA